ncbi:hypothetical protein SPRG_20893, partial [Saprolegnia parasitica CBS 223.65]
STTNDNRFQARSRYCHRASHRLDLDDSTAIELTGMSPLTSSSRCLRVAGYQISTRATQPLVGDTY